MLEVPTNGGWADMAPPVGMLTFNSSKKLSQMSDDEEAHGDGQGGGEVEVALAKALLRLRQRLRANHVDAGGTKAGSSANAGPPAGVDRETRACTMAAGGSSGACVLMCLS